MPSVLAKLNADVLAVNPYASTPGVTGFDASAHAAQVGALVRSAGAHLGAVLDADGERLTVVDDSGHVLTNDEALMAFLSLVTELQPGCRVALPVAVSQAAERLVGRAGGSILWTKLSASHLMEAASEVGVVFAGSQDGGFILPDFLPSYDATAALVHLLSLLAQSGRRLSDVVATLPRVFVAHETVVTPWEQKGLLMRTLVERIKDRELVLVDGVKVLHEDGWALVLPDPDEPITHVWAEGPDETAARNRAQEYARRMRQLLR